MSCFPRENGSSMSCFPVIHSSRMTWLMGELCITSPLFPSFALANPTRRPTCRQLIAEFLR